MAKIIQIRHVPALTYRRLKAKAASEGMSLSDFLRRELQHVAERPTLEEFRRRLAGRRPVKTRVSPARAARPERGR